MPEERTLGALVDPCGHEADGLTKCEYDELKTALAILRRRDGSDMTYSILYHLLLVEGCPREVEERDGLRGFLEWIDAHEGSDGILVDNRTQSKLNAGESWVKEAIRLYGNEFKDLENMLAVLRNGGWFATWIARILETPAQSEDLTERYPTPLQVMQTLTLDNGEFQDSLQAAKEIAKQRPDLLFPAPPAEPEVVADPATTAKRAKAPHARKARKKAA